MTCKDCVHYEVCESEVEAHHDNPRDLEVDGIEEFCRFFKPKSHFVELPCEVGKTVWFVCFGKIYEHKIKRFEITEFGMYACSSSLEFNFEHFDKTVFLSREEAEKALAERSK